MLSKPEWVEIALALTSELHHVSVQILNGKPTGSNSMETSLSRVSCLTEIRFVTREGVTSTLFRWRGLEDVGILAWRHF
jgi:hypothetical protein